MRYFEIEKSIQRSTITAWMYLFSFLLIFMSIWFTILLYFPEIITNTDYFSFNQPDSKNFTHNGKLGSLTPVPPSIFSRSEFESNSRLTGYRGTRIKIIKDGEENFGIAPCKYQGVTDYEGVFYGGDGGGIGNGFGDGIGNDDGGNYVYNYSDLLSDFPTSSVLKFRPIQFACKVDPVYPAVALAAGVQGSVVIKLLIGVSGNPILFCKNGDQYILSPDKSKNNLLFDIISESPEDWFFASNIKKVIPRWKFTPHIENGKPVTHFLRITYDYCFGDTCGFNF